MNRLGAVSRAALVALAGAGCQTQEIRVSFEGRAPRGDTSVVESAGDGVWGPPHDAVEVLRVPGDRKETTFGQIRAVTATPDGGVIVFDAKGAEGRIIRQFDANGKFIRNIGRAGEGPGEYNTADVRVATGPSGEIVVRDEMRALIRYNSAGKFVNGFPLQSGAGRWGLVVGDDGSLYMPRTYSFRSERAPRGDRHPIIRYDTTGRGIDTLAPGAPWLPGSDTMPSGGVRYRASEHWVALSDGRVLVGRTDTVGFLLIDPRGRTGPLMALSTRSRVPYLQDERTELQANADAATSPVEMGGERFPGQERAAVPAHKPASGELRADFDGRVWIGVPMPSEKGAQRCVAFYTHQPGAPSQCLRHVTYHESGTVYVAFKLDGTYLGEVRFSAKTTHISPVGQFAWAVTRDADDVQILTKYRLYQ